MDPRIGDYISTNRKKYTREAITQQLIEAGHDPADVRATWAALDTPDPDKAGLAGEGFWSRFFLFLVGLNVGVFLLVGLTTGILQNADDGGTYASVFAVVLGIGALISRGIVAAVGPDKMGRTTATIIGAVIPLVFALPIGWSCFALVGVIPSPLPAVGGEMELQIGPPLEFEGAGGASCQPYRDKPTFVRAERLGTLDGRTVSASFSGHTVFISLISDFEVFAFLELMAPDGLGSFIEIAAAEDGMSGTATFETLVSMQGDPEVGPTWLSGTISWNCEAP